MNRLYKYIICFSFLLGILLMLPTQVRADDKIFNGASIVGSGQTDVSGTMTNPIDNPGAMDPGEPSGTTQVAQIGGTIASAVNAVGVIVSVAALAVIGIRYMMGSADERADYKQTMVPYIVGAVLLFGTTTIVNIIYQVATSLN